MLRILLRKIYSYVSYRLFAHHRISREDTVRLFGLDLTIPPGVFHPSLYFSTKFLASQLVLLDLRGKQVLEIGSGSGILSIICAKKGATVTAVDIHPLAVEATLKNAHANSIWDSLSIYESDVFDSVVSQGFNLIIFNPPFYSGTPVSSPDHAWRAGENLEFFRRLALDAPRFLAPEGKLIFVLSTAGEHRSTLKIFTESGFQVRVLKARRKLFERLEIIEATHSS